MSLDLQLLPFDADHVDGFSFSHTILDCERDRALFEALLPLQGTPVPAQFHSFVSREVGINCQYGTTTQTPYGEPLEYVTVAALLPFRARATLGKNTAVWAYLACLPPATKVALFWH